MYNWLRETVWVIMNMVLGFSENFINGGESQNQVTLRCKTLKNCKVTPPPLPSYKQPTVEKSELWILPKFSSKY